MSSNYCQHIFNAHYKESAYKFYVFGYINILNIIKVLITDKFYKNEIGQFRTEQRQHINLKKIRYRVPLLPHSIQLMKKIKNSRKPKIRLFFLICPYLTYKSSEFI